jgi:colanic acid biosynthesis protein WcaH
MLSDDIFRNVVRHTPLISIDLLIRDPAGHLLVGERKNDPAKGSLFVPGGRIRKNETLVEAFERILQIETGLNIPFERATLFGVFEHFYDTNTFGEPGYGTHYVVLAYELRLTEHHRVSLDDQHMGATWAQSFNQLMHPNNEPYFAGSKRGEL